MKQNTTIPEKFEHCFALPMFTPEVTIPQELRVNFQSILKAKSGGTTHT